jgi:putative ABC transport system permease protein
MSVRPPAPPRLAAFFARRLSADPAWRDVTLGDLHEEFAAVASAHGVRRARAWYRREVARLALDRLSASIRDGATLVHGIFARGGDTRMRMVWHELKFAARTLMRQPRVTLVVVLTLALGLGANAAVFGMVDSLLLRPFAIRDVDRLVMLSENSDVDTFPLESVAPGNYADWLASARQDPFDRLAAFEWWDVNLSDGDRPARVQGHRVTADLLDMLGAVAARGRLLEPADELPGAPRRIVISDALWRTHFGGADVIGRAVRLDGETYEIAGVLAPGFDFPFANQIWAPLVFSASQATDRTTRYLSTIARLAPGRTVEDAAAAMQTIYARQRAATPDAFLTHRLVVRTFVAGMRDVGLPTILLLWQIAALAVLLIACTNVANLLLAQGAAREREFAVRTALGASRARIVRLLLAEGVVLALAAVPLALVLAAAGFGAIRAAMAPEIIRFIPGWDQMGVDWRIFAMTVALAAMTAVVFGAIPALRASRPHVPALQGTRSVTAGLTRSRLRRVLVVAEVAIALPLLVISGLAALGAHRFASGPQGYAPDGALRLRMILPEATYPDEPARRQFVERLLERVAADPRVAQAATSSILPSTPSNQSRELTIDGRRVDPDRPETVNYRAVSPTYLPVLQIPILGGRGLDGGDRDGRELVAVVSRSLARRYFPDGDAVGREIRLGRPAGPPRRIVGISGDTIDDWFINREVPTVYVPVHQSPSGQVGLVLRGSGAASEASLTEAARAAVASVDPGQAVFDVMTMRHAVHVRTTGLRFVGGLMAVFGAIALVLAAIGLYSVMSSYVAQRRREIGIRMALGAATGDVLRQTIGQGGRLALVGTVAGLALAVALSRLMESALFGIVAIEIWLFAAIAALLLAIALLASVLPARQAAAVDPIAALRAE